MKKKKIISLIIGIILLSFLVHFLYSNSSIFKEIEKINTFSLLIISFLSIFSLYLNGLLLKISTIPFKINIKKHFLLSISTSFFNLITPFGGGAGIRAIYMKKKYKLNYSNFISTLLGNYVIILLFFSATAIISIAAIYYIHGLFNPYFSGIFIIIFLGSLAMIIHPLKIKSSNRFLQNVNKVSDGWKKISKNRNIIVKLALIQFIQLIIFSLITKLAFDALNFKIDLFKSIYISTITTLSTLINITPGSLGITETIYIISSQILHINPAIALLAGITIRAINYIILLGLGPLANYLLLKDIKNTKTQ